MGNVPTPSLPSVLGELHSVPPQLWVLVGGRMGAQPGFLASHPGAFPVLPGWELAASPSEDILPPPRHHKCNVCN